MKTKKNRVFCLLAFTAALATGCTVSVAPPVVDVAPPVAEVTVGVPDSYVWDGYEYVGVVGGQYMYLGPGDVWLACEPFRLERFHGWERGHPDWRRSAFRNEGRYARGRAPVRREERHDDHR
jgi:hypothetical protein